MMAAAKLQTGLIGAGHLGRLILSQLADLPEFDVVGYYDRDMILASKVPELAPWQAFPNAGSLIEASQAVILAVPTPFHYPYAREVILKQRHLFIEKPIAETLKEAREICQWAEQYPHLVVQVGHVERFNPAWQSLAEMNLQPMFIEAHRLAPFSHRGTDVSVILDLMIHDLDLVLQLIPFPVREIRANGVALLSSSPDIANARLEFSHGAVANLTASRVSQKKMRTMRLFQKDTYVSLDFLKKSRTMLCMTPVGSEAFVMEPSKENPLRDELLAFANAINENGSPVVSARDGYRALDLATEILEVIAGNTNSQLRP